MFKDQSQKGSAHLIAVVIIVVVIASSLGFVFWKNFVSKDTLTRKLQTTATQPQKTTVVKKNEVVSLGNGDMDKYINYEQGFEFLFPKNVSGPVGCMTGSTVHDNYGNIIPSQSHYAATQGSAPTTILETGDRFILTTKDVVVLSNRIQSGGYSFAQKCDIQQNSIETVDYNNTVDGDTYIDHTATKEFDITKAANENDITQEIHKILSDDTTSIGTMGPLVDDRQAVTMAVGGNPNVLGFAYKLWYYPSQQKLVYYALGQGAVLVAPGNSNNYYDEEVADSFKFATN